MFTYKGLIAQGLHTVAKDYTNLDLLPKMRFVLPAHRL